MTGFNRALKRKTEATRYSRGGPRQIVIEIPPGGRTVGFRLAKTRKTYYLATGELLALAIRVELAERKRLAKEARKAKR